jgi:beta-xylosidase
MPLPVYTNPVWPDYFADPFVVKVGATYWAYGTAPPDQRGREFPVLQSADLVNWRYVGHALTAVSETRGYPHWAPEVAQADDGRFYLYYSATTSRSDEHHRLRVAVADQPQGPFVDTGRLILPDAGFTIDAHPFRDPNSGRWFLFFATDFLHDVPHGTGLSVVPLDRDMLTPLDKPRVVLRASCPWQVYERNRDYKGRVWEAWHCVEGPFVVYRNDRYWCLYSGGAWHTEGYGVGAAVAADPLGPWRDERASSGPSVLRASRDLRGPGHVSVTRSPDDRFDVLVYHAWDREHTARRLCIDPLEWTDQGPRVR